MTLYSEDLFGASVGFQMCKLFLRWFFFPTATVGLFTWAGSLNYAIFLFNKGWKGEHIWVSLHSRFALFANPLTLTPDLNRLPPQYKGNRKIKLFSYMVWISYFAFFCGSILGVLIAIYAAWRFPNRPINLFHVERYVLEWESRMKWCAIVPTGINLFQFLILIPKGYFQNAYSVYRKKGPCRWKE